LQEIVNNDNQENRDREECTGYLGNQRIVTVRVAEQIKQDV
jgi:hypothetical protein